MKLMLRKVQYAPETQGVAPSVETTRDFLMSDKPLHVAASLEKEVSGFLRHKSSSFTNHEICHRKKTQNFIPSILLLDLTLKLNTEATITDAFVPYIRIRLYLNCTIHSNQCNTTSFTQK